MSLAITEEKIKRVLLVDGWHDVVESTFTLDSYEILDGEEASHKGGQSGICATGFKFTSRRKVIPDDNAEGYEERPVVITGPLNSIIAMELNEIG